MTWSGNMKQRDAIRPRRRQRNNSSCSSSSSRGTPSPKLFEDRMSPVNSSDGSRIVRFSPQPMDTRLSRSPSPQGAAYAGARFNDPPLPEFLPKPPSHWIVFGEGGAIPASCTDMSSQLKQLLKVACQQA